MKKITIEDVEFIAHGLAKEMMTWDEPIPGFDTRFPNLLESCVNTPFQTFGGEFLYPGLYEKAAILFYLMIKNHPFQNGNKRVAVTALFVFLGKNKKWIKVDHQELYNFAVWVAASPPKFKEEVVRAIVKFLRSYVVEG